MKKALGGSWRRCCCWWWWCRGQKECVSCFAGSGPFLKKERGTPVRSRARNTFKGPPFWINAHLKGDLFLYLSVSALPIHIYIYIYINVNTPFSDSPGRKGVRSMFTCPKSFFSAFSFFSFFPLLAFGAIIFNENIHALTGGAFPFDATRAVNWPIQWAD